MYYWPLSTIVQSPLMNPTYAPELYGVHQNLSLSNGAMMACSEVMSRTAPVSTSLVIVQSDGAPMRRVYLEYPQFDEWLRLERGGFFADHETFGFVIDALH